MTDTPILLTLMTTLILNSALSLYFFVAVLSACELDQHTGVDFLVFLAVRAMTCIPLIWLDSNEEVNTTL